MTVQQPTLVEGAAPYSHVVRVAVIAFAVIVLALALTYILGSPSLGQASFDIAPYLPY